MIWRKNILRKEHLLYFLPYLQCLSVHLEWKIKTVKKIMLCQFLVKLYHIDKSISISVNIFKPSTVDRLHLLAFVPLGLFKTDERITIHIDGHEVLERLQREWKIATNSISWYHYFLPFPARSGRFPSWTWIPLPWWHSWCIPRRSCSRRHYNRRWRSTAKDSRDYRRRTPISGSVNKVLFNFMNQRNDTFRVFMEKKV